MSYKFGTTSTQRLETLDERLQKILKEAIKFYDFSILEGYRSRDKQDELFKKGFSKAKAGESKHNLKPSLAVDIQPYPIDVSLAEEVKTLKGNKERAKFYFLAGIIFHIAHIQGVQLRWGGSWDGTYQFNQNSFDDLFHFEIVEGDEK
jgi:peptidoglycan L-alanyl-D-glutamate endopeptidase CwlK